MLSFARSIKNKFTPINRIPGAILSLIPKYLQRRVMDTDKDFVTLTHVCRGWRELFISQPSLWTRLDLTNIEKTRTYIARSKSSPLDIIIHDSGDKAYIDNAFLLAVPHVTRFKSLTIGRTSDSLRGLARHPTFPVPFLEELIMDFACDPAPSLNVGLFNGNFSSLRTLKLAGVVTNLPWRNLRNLTTFEFRCPQPTSITAPKLLDFLKSAPYLKDVTLQHSIPASSKRLSSRTVHLYHLKNLTIVAGPGHAILLNHLSIPEKASIVLEFNFCRNKTPLPGCLPSSAWDLRNLSRITAVNLLFARTKKFVRLVGPGGGLHIFGHWEPQVEPPLDLDRRIFNSLDRFSFQNTQRLTITQYRVPTESEINKSPAYGFLSRMGQLHTLQPVQCNNVPFILALNPNCNPSESVFCPDLEELILYVEARDEFNISVLMNMANGRASKGAKLRSITIIGLGQLVPAKEVFQLREYVTHVEYKFEESPPRWDSNPDVTTGAPEPCEAQPSPVYDLGSGEATGVLIFEQKTNLACISCSIF